MERVKARLELGKKKYGHGVRVNDDTTTWGTSQNSWMEMADEEFLDAIVYILADYIRQGRENPKALMSDMEVKYKIFALGEGTNESDDNELILFSLANYWDLMEPCRHKTLIHTLMSILDPTLTKWLG